MFIKSSFYGNDSILCIAIIYFSLIIKLIKTIDGENWNPVILIFSKIFEFN